MDTGWGKREVIRFWYIFIDVSGTETHPEHRTMMPRLCVEQMEELCCQFLIWGKYLHMYVCVYIHIYVCVYIYIYISVCKLKTQECQWCNSVWVQNPENQRNQWCKSQSEVKCPSSTEKRRGRNSLVLCIVLFSPSTDWMMLTTVGRTIYFIESIDSNGNLSQKYPHRYPEVMFDLGPCGQWIWHIKLIITEDEIKKKKSYESEY